MATEPTGITESCEAFVLSISEGRYYDAHEDLEPLWYPRRFEDNNEVRLWKGFINAAVSFELAKRGRKEASAKAWQTYLKYFSLLENLVTPHKELYVKIAKLLEKKHGMLCASAALSRTQR
ncbi:hypothetical protein Sulku_0063 [Sulfuricurvum kujiense DSM 16994]|uniref:DUF309 domain-containing protein n=1 Tax=Sulfuricurvum kujiense (strain ATCC BAA-921 / DSM 16994 / JCM 11577 / YK-1) TaxID=709032 RepID=E4TWB5_SULKY|nr:DUF309 domain-containing protein [Sulfuricurvum kujiense]ADR32731.1 hypothetical protein Sulku_0063 [Sulfuricurvum kujiense DSM 16994]